ncbi:hypothetical protein K1719_036754 [Acacia pycnantha]|nr:hypothetical protein K1719_036754 [Acacia pycnantha]
MGALERQAKLCKQFLSSESLVIADLGLSGPNNFCGFRSNQNSGEALRGAEPSVPRIPSSVFLNDLPDNDFNNIFRSLASFKDRLSHEMVSGVGPCFVSGVPGSGGSTGDNSKRISHSFWSVKQRNRWKEVVWCSHF